MCGLFGVVLPDRYPRDIPVGFAVDLLGIRAEDRGHDAAGLAVRGRDGTWRVAKTVGGYRRLRHTHRRLAEHLDGATIVLGHTRWATQGGLGVAQASPIEIAGLLGTHNGDIEPASIPDHHGRRLPLDEKATDSHYLFGAIAAAHRRSPQGAAGVTEQLVSILSTMRGRAALVWTDTNRPDGQIWLARAGLSPLAVGTDPHGGLWWASNPAWLRDLSTTLGLTLSITLIPKAASGPPYPTDPMSPPHWSLSSNPPSDGAT